MPRSAIAGPRLRSLTPGELAGLQPSLREVVEYRKSGLSLNWIVGCPLDCGYCVRHLFGNFAMKTPRMILDDREAFDALTQHPYFRPHLTPVQLLNRATDPMLPAVKPHLFAMLRMLDDAGLTNDVLLITRWRIGPDDCAALNALHHLRVTVLVTYSGIDDPRIEPVDSAIAAASLRTAADLAERYRVILYWRPIVPGLNDTDAHLDAALDLAEQVPATVFTGLFYRSEIRAYYRAHDLPEPYPDTARRKILPATLEQRILSAAAGRGDRVRLFRKTSCAVSYVHGRPDYNGHVGVPEICDICPLDQLRRCRAAVARVELPVAAQLATRLGGQLVGFSTRTVTVTGLDEQRRYVLQHTLSHQVHDLGLPHLPRRHGRADLGWSDTAATPDPATPAPVFSDRTRAGADR